MRRGQEPKRGTTSHAVAKKTGCAPKNGPQQDRLPKTQTVDTTAARSKCLSYAERSGNNPTMTAVKANRDMLSFGQKLESAIKG
ncbi:hypothetical protein NDU88_001375 [Pleurodeles waltl]|uniref:Uncharacterized protein n=1 Tax=Pleurodeles waltl TaxID=8319 RepID=A0AAV7MKB3_PLEWA|nr:hypothetical protein NDU88_001375 [Pleurodeles waltl]